MMTGTWDDNICEQQSFPQFARLPVELRLRVWQHLCVELNCGPSGRVFPVKLVLEGDVPYSIQPTDDLKNQTALARAVLATNREARDEALKFFPDTFTISNGSGLVRFTAKRDIVLLDGTFNAPWMRDSWNFHIDGFSDQIVNLALGTDYMSFRLMYFGRTIDDIVHTTWFLLLFLNPFRRLDTLYYCWDDEREDEHLKQWCASDLVHRYHFLPDRESASGNELEQTIYCWLDTRCEASQRPDSMENQLFTNEPGPWPAEIWNMLELLSEPAGWPADMRARIHRIIEPLGEDDIERLGKIYMRKMIVFLSSDGLRRFHALDPGSEALA